jgi:Na+/phosphate symporter
MTNHFAEISLNLAEQLEEAIIKEASLMEEIDALKSEIKNLQAQVQEVDLEKKASAQFDAAMLSATTSLEQAGFLSQGTAVQAYQALMDNPKEVPVLLEKLASALTQNFSEGSSFSEGVTKQASSNEEPNPWIALIDKNFE